MFGETSTQLADEAGYCEYFSERDSVNPDDASTFKRPKTRRNLPHAFAESSAIFAMTQSLIDPVRRAQKQRK